MSNGFLARGKVLEAKDSLVIFNPADTTYQLYLQISRPYDGPLNEFIEARIRAKARKVHTVPSGGGFIAPIFGSPRTLQGRALHVDDRQVVIRAGTPISVDLPPSDDGIDLTDGPVKVGEMINVLAFAGATFEYVPAQPQK